MHHEAQNNYHYYDRSYPEDICITLTMLCCDKLTRCTIGIQIIIIVAHTGTHGAAVYNCRSSYRPHSSRQLHQQQPDELWRRPLSYKPRTNRVKTSWTNSNGGGDEHSSHAPKVKHGTSGRMHTYTLVSRTRPLPPQHWMYCITAIHPALRREWSGQRD